MTFCKSIFCFRHIPAAALLLIFVICLCCDFGLKKLLKITFFLEIFTKNQIFFLTDVFLIGRAGQPTILLQ
ncbi:hypothetical protein JO41_11545 [Treponema sp. OMZ 838]|nr:hypothetical protein JO41_11545 [Treponema sp. OMZ 838]